MMRLPISLPNRQFGNHLAIVRDLAGFDAGGADICGATAARGVGAVALVPYYAFADDFAVSIAVVGSGEVSQESEREEERAKWM
jgi:hypothetical protein